MPVVIIKSGVALLIATWMAVSGLAGIFHGDRTKSEIDFLKEDYLAYEGISWEEEPEISREVLLNNYVETFEEQPVVPNKISKATFDYMEYSLPQKAQEQINKTPDSKLKKQIILYNWIKKFVINKGELQ